MTKKDLTESVAQQSGYSYTEVERIIELATKTIKSNVAQGKTIYLRCFGSFTAKKRKAKIGHNMRTGAKVVIPERFMPAFQPSQKFINAVIKAN